MKNYFDLFECSARVIFTLALCSLGTLNSMAQEERSEYVPFVEEGKAWYCSRGGHLYDNPPVTAEDPNGEGIDCIFTMHGDTLINDREYKKVYCQFEEYYGNKEQHYYCAVREEASQVFIIEEKTAEEKLIYDFSQTGKTITLSYNDTKYVRTGGGRRYDFLSGQLEFSVCKLSGDEIQYSYGSSSWIDGVGAYNYNPFSLEIPFLLNEPKLGKEIFVVTCMKDGKYIYDLDWMAEPIEVTSINDSFQNDDSIQKNYTYDLQGRRLADKPQKGVYIKDGRKYVK